MKSYLYYFEFFSGFFESYFYKEVHADNDHDAITQVISYCLNISEEAAAERLENELGKTWTPSNFWEKASTQFDNGSEGYNLIWIKELDLNLQCAGRYV